MYKGPDTKAQRLGKNMLKEQARFDVPVSVAKGAIAGAITANPFVGLAVGGVSYGVWSTMSLASNGVAIARGRKTYYDKVDEQRAEIKKMQDKAKTDEPKWKKNGYSSEAEHKAAIDAAAKHLEKQDGGKVVSTYYDKNTDWSSEKKTAAAAVDRAEEKLTSYREWNRDFDPNYSKKHEAQLEKEVSEARAKFRSL